MLDSNFGFFMYTKFLSFKIYLFLNYEIFFLILFSTTNTSYVTKQLW
jgi:hypothetical protein